MECRIQPREDEVEHHADEEAGQCINGIVGQNVYRGKTHQYIEGQDGEDEAAAARAERQQHDYRRHAHMAAGERSRGSLSRVVGQVEHVVPETVGPPRCSHALGMGEEPVAHVGEYAAGYLVGANRQIVELGTGDGQQDEDDIESEERGENDEGRHLELMVAAEEIVEIDDEHEREIADVAQAHQFGEPAPRHLLREHQCRLATEERLLQRGKHMVEVGQHAVQFIRVGIPPAQKRHLHQDAQKHGKPTGHHAVDGPHGHRRGDKAEAAPQHRLRVLHLRPHEAHHQHRQQQIAHGYPLHCQQSFHGLFLQYKQFSYLQCSIYHF